jgi:polysaccharide chain length determinant protein (PEP-CTERM system associated)
MQMYPEQIVKALVTETFHSRRLVVAGFFLVNVVMLAAGLMWPKTYSASSTILVDEKGVIEPLMQGAAVAADVTDTSKNVRELIFGRVIMDGVMQKGGWLGKPLTQSERDDISDQIKGRTTIATIGKNVIRIDYRDSSPERASIVAKAFADLYIRKMIGEKESEIRAAFDFIDKQVQEYEQRLSKTETQLRQIRSTNLDAGPLTEVELSARLITLNNRIENATTELREAEMKSASIKSQLSGQSDVNAFGGRDSGYSERLAELQTKLDNLRLTYLDSHPDVVQVKNQIQDLKNQMERREKAKPSDRPGSREPAVTNPAYPQLRRDLSQNQLVIDTLKARLSEAQRLLREEVARGKNLGGGRLGELTRDYQINREIYQDLLHRRERARVSMNLDSDRQELNFKVLDATPASPAGRTPRFWQFVLGGLLLGVLIPVGLLFARMQLDPHLRLAQMISTTHNVPVAAVVPHLWSPEELGGLRKDLLKLAVAVAMTVVLSAAVTIGRVLGKL